MPHPWVLQFAKDNALSLQALGELDELITRLVGELHRGPPNRTLAGEPVDNGNQTVDWFSDESVAVVDAQSDADLPTCASDADRFDNLGLLGVGGMGEVFRVRDPVLNRVMALKYMKNSLLSDEVARARFLSEARITSQLQHPGILPVHEFGRAQDGRLFFTMQQVDGRTLTEVIDEVHEAVRDNEWCETRNGWSFRTLVSAFHQVCEAVAYAHARGVIHRDLKPDNIMVGAHGSVLVLDWGFAKILGSEAIDGASGSDSVWEGQDGARSVVGSVTGTPAYMSPEQARGENDELTPSSDVYAMGAILYQILTGESPFDGPDALSILKQKRQATEGLQVKALEHREDQATTSGPPLPRALLQACGRAMQIDTSRRYADASGLANAVQDWLNGVRRESQAQDLVDRARRLIPRIMDYRAEAAALDEQANQIKKALPSVPTDEDLRPVWEMQDRVERIRRRADQTNVQQEWLLQAALSHSAILADAHIALAERYRTDHMQAEAAGDRPQIIRAEGLLERHVRALPRRHRARLELERYLHGEGSLSLETVPSGAEVFLDRYVEEDRRLVPKLERSLGRTPLVRVPIASGSYRLRIQSEGRPEVVYPVRIDRLQHWHGRRPERRGCVGEGPDPVWIPPSLDDAESYVPAGWTTVILLQKNGRSVPSRVWLDGFVCRRKPVTVGEYLAFINDLVERGREDEARRHRPRERVSGTEGGDIFGRDESGRYVLVPDSDGHLWDLDWGMMCVNFPDAIAYARWFGEKTGSNWRLPSELEWEKVARGVDGRKHPWGDHIEAGWASRNDSSDRSPMPERVSSFSIDRSVYGVDDLGGGLRDWTCSTEDDGHSVENGRIRDQYAGMDLERARTRVARGPCWGDGVHYDLSTRMVDGKDVNSAFVGFRLVRSPSESSGD